MRRGELPRKGRLRLRLRGLIIPGTQCGAREGLAIFDSPRNPWFPSKWFTRDYGFFSPTPFEWLDEKGVKLASGKSLELHYRVIVHAGDAGQAGIADSSVSGPKSRRRSGEGTMCGACKFQYRGP